jgi:signal transduction histidine kinase
MIGHLVARVRTVDRLLLFGAFMVVVYWLVETYVDTLVGMGSYASRLLPYGDINELWMRGIIIFLIVLFTRYARASVARQKRHVEALRASEEQLRQSNQQLERANAELAEVMERQERFAAAASHELRTPLTVLQGTLELALLRDRTPTEHKEILSRAATEVVRMGTLIDDLLALARVQSDREILAREPLDLRAVAREAAKGVKPLAARKGQTLEVELDGPLPTCGDQLKLCQALTNLLDNAISYTPQGGAIRLSARAVRGRAVIAVRDTGPGIEAQHLPHLFEPFYRGDPARGGGSGHAGLGLALAAWIVQAHGGHLEAESRIGVGTVFTLTLPLGESPPPT